MDNPSARATGNSTTGLVLHLTFPISVNAVWRAAGGRVHRSARYKAWLKLNSALWLSQKPRGPFNCIKGKFKAQIWVSPPDERKRDLMNLCKGIFDFCQMAEIIEDDANCIEYLVKWVPYQDAPEGIKLLIEPVGF